MLLLKASQPRKHLLLQFPRRRPRLPPRPRPKSNAVAFAPVAVQNQTVTRLIDAHSRQIRDLRISITDRCNFRCLYCLPETEEASGFL